MAWNRAIEEMTGGSGSEEIVGKATMPAPCLFHGEARSNILSAPWLDHPG